jgi:LCP family protein required for cell wall assembly
MVSVAALAAGLPPHASPALSATRVHLRPPAERLTLAAAPADAGGAKAGSTLLAQTDTGTPSPTQESSWWSDVRQAVGDVPDTVGDMMGAGAQPALEPLTILLLGVDARPGETIDFGIRADAILLLHLDPRDRSCRLLAIPRDTRAELPGYGQSKINHALAVGGIPYQIDVIERFLGLDISRHALADFQAFAIVVDAIGGVTLTVEEPFTMGDVAFEAGEQHLTGEDALAFVRYRGGADGDFGRIARQQQMVRAIAAQASGLDLVRGAGDILTAIEQHLRTDLSLVEISSLIAVYQATCGPDAIALESLTGEIATFPDPVVGQELSYVVVSDEAKAAGVAYLLGEGD